MHLLSDVRRSLMALVGIRTTLVGNLSPPPPTQNEPNNCISEVLYKQQADAMVEQGFNK